MVKEHGIIPVSDHYSCMIDLYSRAGQLEESKRFIHDMPFSPDAFGWSTLLSSCRSHGNLDIGEWAAKSLQELEPNNPASYVLLLSMYAAKGKWDDVARLRSEMRHKDIRKETGFSWIKYKNKVYAFSADDRTSPYSDKIYEKLESLNSKMLREGYVPDMRFALHNVDESEKIMMLNHHSEKLAIGVLLYLGYLSSFLNNQHPHVGSRNIGSCHISVGTQQLIILNLSMDMRN
ncbi:putative pentatricopeptide repeat-containing protein [Tanacetum coccineum]